MIRPLSASPALRRWQAAQGGLPRTGFADPSARRVAAVRTSPSRGKITDQERIGHLSAGPDETILYFNNLFPVRLGRLLPPPWRADRDLAELLQRFEASSPGSMDPIGLIKTAIPKAVPVKVTEILPRLDKEGGAFVKVVAQRPNIAPADIEDAIAKPLAEKPLKPWFSPFRGIGVGLVKGVPWLEDIHRRQPQSRLRVEFVAPKPGGTSVELPQETLYSLFRKYGTIADIISQETDSKVLPRYAYLDYTGARDAIMARNCLHGFVVPEALGGGKDGTRIRLSYEQRIRASKIWSWLTGHPRVVFPLLAAVLATVTVIVFDPIRQFFIRTHVQKSYSFENVRIWKWFKRQTSDMLPFARQKSEKSALHAVFSHRRDLVETLRKWLIDSDDTFIVVQGPRGSGKKELVLDEALRDRPNVLVVDCKAIIRGGGESGTIKKLAAAVGYRPVFSWANNISSMIDLAIQSTTGVKSGFSETLESQVVKILQTTAAALKEISGLERGKHAKNCDEISEEVFLEAHPERRAVVVIDNFLHGGQDGSGIVYEKIAEWAAALVQNNVAHVVFLTDQATYSKSLARALPDRVFRLLSLGDLEPEIAREFIKTRILDDDHPARHGGKSAAEPTGTQTRQHQGQGHKEAPPALGPAGLSELDQCLGVMGGRLTDLESLARRLKSGQTPTQATRDIIDLAAAEIVKMFLLGRPSEGSGSGSSSSSSARTWSPQQAWHLVRALAAEDPASQPVVSYNSLLLRPTFASSTSVSDPEAALAALADADLISISVSRGQPREVRPGKPAYAAAFAVLASDPVLRARMDLMVLEELAAVQAQGIQKVEQELALLGSLPRQPSEAAGRVSYLLAKLEGSQRRIGELEADMGELKKAVGREEKEER